jgi:hypothetical protein
LERDDTLDGDTCMVGGDMIVDASCHGIGTGAATAAAGGAAAGINCAMAACGVSNAVAAACVAASNVAVEDEKNVNTSIGTDVGDDGLLSLPFVESVLIAMTRDDTGAAVDDDDDEEAGAPLTGDVEPDDDDAGTGNSDGLICCDIAIVYVNTITSVRRRPTRQYLRSILSNVSLFARGTSAYSGTALGLSNFFCACTNTQKR